jgi:hypothetical protein
MKVVAEVFQGRRSGFMNHFYWDDLDEMKDEEYDDPVDYEIQAPSCTLI